MITNVINKSTKKAIKPDEQITVKPVVAIVKDLVTENVEDGHIIFCEDASNIFYILVDLGKLVFLCFLSR
jgi:hypothetical protein